MRYRKTLGFFVGLLMIVAAAAIFLLPGAFSARAKPLPLEAWVAGKLRHFAVPAAIRDQTNPVPLTDEVLVEARDHFADHCAICHGKDGSGQTEMGKNFYPKAPDMKEAETQSLSDGELFYAIANGVRLTGMPAWGSGTAEDDQDSWKLVHFIRHLPKITKDEVREMEKMNPKSQADNSQADEEERFLRGDDTPSKITKDEVREMEKMNPKSQADNSQADDEERFLRGDDTPSKTNPKSQADNSQADEEDRFLRGDDTP